MFGVRHALNDIEPLVKLMQGRHAGYEPLSTQDWNAFLRVRDRLHLAARNLRSHAEGLLSGKSPIHLAAVTTAGRAAQSR